MTTDPKPASADSSPSLLTLTRDALRTWRVRVVLALWLLLGFALWMSPLTNHLGYAASLVIAVLSVPAVSFLSAGLPHRWRSTERQVPARTAFSFATILGLALPLALGVFSALGGVLFAPCAQGGGTLAFVLIALPGPLLASLLSLGLGAQLQRRWLATLCALSLLPFFIAWTLVRFYQTPAVFAYDPLFGFFPGALYDENIPIGITLFTYRVGTLAAISLTVSLGVLVWSPATSTLAWKSLRASRERLFPAIGSAIVMLSLYFAGPALGHRHDADDIAQTLGARLRGPRCEVVYAHSIDAREARLTLEDCHIRLSQLETFFGVRMNGPVTVFLFADADQKQALMGAADTFIAKPWRREVYLQHHAFPHPVLKHELAHVVAGQMGAWPLRISARALFIPLPGLVEGAAVAAAWEGESDATPHQWSRAMLEMGRLPRVDVLTGLGFFLHASGTAYTAAGSFSRWLIETRGPVAYAKLYRNGDFQSAYGQDVNALEAAWHAYLMTVPISEDIRRRTRVRFHRVSLLSRGCPHETAALADRAVQHLEAGDLQRAQTEFEEVLRNDPTELGARVRLAEIHTRLHHTDKALELIAQATQELGPAGGARLRVRVADVLWRWEGAAPALTALEGVDPNLFEDDEARSLEIKMWALQHAPSDRDHLVAEAMRVLLVGRGEVASNLVAGTGMLGLALSDPSLTAEAHSLARYLVARQLVGQGEFAEGLPMLLGADVGLMLPRVRAERLRLRAMAEFGLQDLAATLATLRELAALTDRPAGVTDLVMDWIDRVQRMQQRQHLE